MGEPILLGFPNRIDEAVLSGGGWVATLPLANIQTRLLAKVARSVNLMQSNTRFVIDMTRSRKTKLLTFINHNWSINSQVEIIASNSLDMSNPLYQAKFDVWGGLITAGWDIDLVEWENDNFWLGTYTEEEIEGFTATSTHILPMPVTARYWSIRIIDPTNASGYVQLGRVFIGDAIQPMTTYTRGSGFGYETLTEVETALGGAEFFDIREPTRIFRFSLEHLGSDEAYGKLIELIRRAGIHGEIMLVPDPSDEFNGLRRNFMGRIKQPNLLEQTTWLNDQPVYSMSFEIKELR